MINPNTKKNLEHYAFTQKQRSYIVEPSKCLTNQQNLLLRLIVSTIYHFNFTNKLSCVETDHKIYFILSS